MVVDRSGKLLDFVAQGVSAPPLETIRYDTYRGTHRYILLGVSDGFRSREEQFQRERDALNRQPPSP